MGSFALAVDRFARNGMVNIDLVGRKIAFEVYRRVVFRTPVRTGAARGNWMCTVGAPAMPTPGLAAVNDTDKSGRSTVQAIREGVTAWKPSSQVPVFLSNNLPYIEALEHGSSRQAPSGMVAITVAEFGGIATDAAGEAQAGTFGGSRSGLEMGSGWDIGGAGE